jgi:energy-coupling factor transporter ATP-binding protein EcfA2
LTFYNKKYEKLRELKEKMGLTILLVEHRLELALPIADSIIVLNDGRVVLEGDPRSLLGEMESLIVLKSSRVLLPPIIETFWELAKRGYRLPKPPLTTNEFLELLGREKA